MENTNIIDYSMAKPVKECRKQAKLCSVPPPSQRNAPETCFGLPQQPTYYNNLYVQNPMTSYTSAALRAYVDKNVFYALSQIDANWSSSQENANTINYFIAKTVEECQKRAEFCRVLPPPQSNAPETRFSIPQQPTYIDYIPFHHSMTSYRSATPGVYLDRNVFYSPSHIDANCSFFPRSDTHPANPYDLHNTHLQFFNFKDTLSCCHVARSMLPKQSDGPQPPQLPPLRSQLCRSTCECPNCAEIDRLGPAGMHMRNYYFHIPGCGNAFGQTSDFKAHLRRHTGETPFVCKWSFCRKRFMHSAELQRHLRTHSDDKPFVCKICSKWFRKSKYLSQHEKTHTAKKRFTCNICSRRYKNSAYFSKHVKAHIAPEDRKKTRSNSGKCSDLENSLSEPHHLGSSSPVDGSGANLGQPQHLADTTKCDETSHP